MVFAGCTVCMRIGIQHPIQHLLPIRHLLPIILPISHQSYSHVLKTKDMEVPCPKGYFRSSENSCAVDCLFEAFYFGLSNDASQKKSGKKFGELQQLLLTASEHRVGTLPSELPQLREPVWTWLCNRVRSFKSVGTPNTAIADVWPFLSPTDDDQALFAIQIEWELHCVNCDRVTTIKQTHTPLLLSTPCIEEVGGDIETAVPLQIDNMIQDSVRNPRCPQCNNRGMQGTGMEPLVDIPV